MGRNKGVQLLIWVSEELNLAIKQHAEKIGETVSDVLRRLMSKELGRPELAQPPPRGRPKKITSEAVKEWAEANTPKSKKPRKKASS